MNVKRVPILSVGDGVGSPLEDATGQSFAVREWSGSGPAELHVHHEDDEAWHVLTGALRFRFTDGEIDASAGSTMFVPAGVAHTFLALTPDTRYLIVLTPRLLSLIQNLHADQDRAAKAAVYRAHASHIID